MARKVEYEATNGNTRVEVVKGSGLTGTFWMTYIYIRGERRNADLSYTPEIAIKKADRWLLEAGSQLD